jgi:hypothetical protein
MGTPPSVSGRPRRGWFHHWLISKPVHTGVHHLVTALIGVVALAIGILSLEHPIATWLYGGSRGADAPPVLGVDFLVIPVVLIGIMIRRIAFALELDLEAWREHRQRRRQRPP